MRKGAEEGWIEEVHLTSLQGLGASYRMRGFFIIKLRSADDKKSLRVEFSGVAFGGNYGGHNVNIEIGEDARDQLISEGAYASDEIEAILAEVQRMMLNNEMIIDYDSIKPEEDEANTSSGLP